jgi:hypothetical protein
MYASCSRSTRGQDARMSAGLVHISYTTGVFLVYDQGTHEHRAR